MLRPFPWLIAFFLAASLHAQTPPSPDEDESEGPTPEALEAKAAGRDVAKAEIKMPTEVHDVDAKSVVNLGDFSRDWVIRRMTADRIEAWTPRHGWLFDAKDAKARLINEAAPPRRDGEGREWHGAFLPDGRWITTDLWEMDKTLYIFSRAGRQVKEIKAVNLVPLQPEGPPDSLVEKYPDGGPWNQSLIGWARCDRHGKGWVVSVGDGPGRGRAFVTPDGKCRLLPDPKAPWALCYGRDLEPKGLQVAWDVRRPSDDLKSIIDMQSAGHGMYVLDPTYKWGGKGGGKNEPMIPYGEDCGFLPRTHDVFIVADDTAVWDGTSPRTFKTWFFASGGECRGWIGAAYLADAADGKGTCYRAQDNSVVTLDSRLKPISRERFGIGGVAATPVKLFTDLKVGFFSVGKQLVLARW